MKSMFLMMVLGVSMLSLAGCETLTDTPGENYNRMAHAVRTNVRQIPEDVENILLLDHPSRLTDKPVPNE